MKPYAIWKVLDFGASKPGISVGLLFPDLLAGAHDLLVEGNEGKRINASGLNGGLVVPVDGAPCSDPMVIFVNGADAPECILFVDKRASSLLMPVGTRVLLAVTGTKPQTRAFTSWSAASAGEEVDEI